MLMMKNFVWFTVILLSFVHCESTAGSSSNPVSSANFTHRLNMTIAVDGQLRGNLGIGLYGSISPQATLNFLSQCETNVKEKNMGAMMQIAMQFNVTNSVEELAKKFSFEDKQIYRMIAGETMQFGDYFYHPKYSSRGNITVYGRTYKSEVNEIETGLGALAQEREEESGIVGGEYTIFRSRANYDGPSSLWHVFGQVYANIDLLKYLFETAGDNDGVPKRNLTIRKCEITYFIKKNETQAAPPNATSTN